MRFFKHCVNFLRWCSAVTGFLTVSLAFETQSASAEVFCFATKFQINGYIYGMAALENIQLADGSTMPSVSLCGNNCSDPATSQRLATAMTAQARGIPLQLYFANVSSCNAITAYNKPFGVTLRQ